MKVITIILIMIAITMAISSITLITKNIDNEEQFKPPSKHINTPPEKNKPVPLKKASRFLVQQEKKSPRDQADHCHSHHETCFLADKSTCCNNKCVDLKTDHQNCGKCGKKCEFTEDCCGGKCVELAYDNKHCGGCNKKCLGDLLCIYGMCDYP